MPLPDPFDLRARGSSLSREIRGGVATFLTMAYILVANANILIAAGIPKDSAVACTALAAGVCSILMGVVGNFPLALAAGMGLNVTVAFQITELAGTWQRAMGLVVLNGVLVLLLVLLGLREAVMRAIPRDLRLAIGAGIGLFIAFIGLSHAGIVVAGKATLLAPGHLREPATYTAMIGLVLTTVLFARRVKGALLIGILATAAIGLLTKVTHLPSAIFALPNFDIAFQAEVRWALANLVRQDHKTGEFYLFLLPALLSIVMVDFFDTLGTVTAVAEEGNLATRPATAAPATGGVVPANAPTPADLAPEHDDEAPPEIPNLRRILLVDSLAAAIGGLLGSSSNTSYVESAAGVAEGARTGLHSVVVGILFLACIFLAPVASAVPTAATAPALILVGFLMLSQMAKIDFAHVDTAIPAFITLLTIPFTFSIAHGIGYGFLTYTLLKLLSGRPRDPHPLMYLTSAAFAAYFLFGRS